MNDFATKHWRNRAKKALSKGRRLLVKSWWVKPQDPDLEREIWLLRLDLDVLKKMLRETCSLVRKLPQPVRNVVSKF